MIDTIINDDCFNVLPQIEDESIDMILCDLPYGVLDKRLFTWDECIDLDKLWQHYERIIKPNGAILFFTRQPFSAKVLMSNPSLYRYEIIWQKEKGSDFGNIRKKPLNAHENILVFYKHQPTYNPQMEEGKPYERHSQKTAGLQNYNRRDGEYHHSNTGYRYPVDVLKFSRDNIRGEGSSLHPTQKPIALLEWLIKSYTNEGDTVLDPTMGSGSTCVAAKNTGRHYIGIEIDNGYYETAKARLDNQHAPTVQEEYSS